MRYKIIVITLIALFLFSLLTAKLLDIKEVSNQIVVIPINGVIRTEGSTGFIDENVASSSVIVSFIEKAEKNDAIKGILLEINSPGGTVIASKEIAESVKKSKKPTVAWIREVGASGAYWVASASDKIVADPLAITGSIGVTGSYLEFSELFEKHGITYQELASGKYKEVGSPFKELTKEERALLEERINVIHNYFVDEVARNRNLDRKSVEELATGAFYLGGEAKELGLVDVLGNREDAINLLKNMTGLREAELVKYELKRGFFDSLRRLSLEMFYFMGKGIGGNIKLISEKEFNLELR